MTRAKASRQFERMVRITEWKEDCVMIRYDSEESRTFELLVADEWWVKEAAGALITKVRQKRKV